MAPAIVGQLELAAAATVVVVAVVGCLLCSTAGWKQTKLSLPFGVAMKTSDQMMKMPMRLAAAVAGSGGREPWQPGWPTRRCAIERRLGFGRSNRLMCGPVTSSSWRWQGERRESKKNSRCQREHVSDTGPQLLACE